MKTPILALLWVIVASAADTWIVSYSTTEPCNECNVRYAVVCYTPGCDVPPKTVERFRAFESADAALAFLNELGLPKRGVDVNSALLYQLAPEGPLVRGSAKLFRAQLVPIREKVQTKTVPPPPPSTEEVVTFEASLNRVSGR